MPRSQTLLKIEVFSMKLLTAAFSRLPEFQQLLSALEGGRSPMALSGAAAIHRVHAAAAIGLPTHGRLYTSPTPRDSFDSGMAGGG